MYLNGKQRSADFNAKQGFQAAVVFLSITNRKPLMTTPPLGIYRHYKGNLYQLLHIARHSETEEPLAVYRALYGDYGVWVRPLAMFTESVDTANGSVARFALEKALD